MIKLELMKWNLMSFGILLLIGCSQRNQENKRPIHNKAYQKLATLVESGNDVYNVDSNVSSYPRCTQLYVDPANKKYYTFLNKADNSIYFYDAASKLLLFKTTLPVDGIASIGKKTEGYYIKNFDTIFAVSEYMLGIFDTSAKLKAKVDFYKFRKKLGNSSILSMGSVRQVGLYNDFIVLNNVPDIYADKQSDFDATQCGIKFSFSKPQETKYIMPYPYPYQLGVYGANFLSFYSAYDEQNSNMVYSFPNDDFIQVYALKSDSIKEFYGGSEFIDTIMPMKKPSNDFDGYNKHYLLSPSYASIIFDKFNNVFYRFALRPVSEKDYEARKWWKKKSIIILDSSFKKIGEEAITDSCSFLDAYITEDGLHLNSSIKGGPIVYKKFILKKISNVH